LCRAGPDAIDRLIARLGPDRVIAALAPYLTAERLGADRQPSSPRG
jgi:hypothetical protein